MNTARPASEPLVWRVIPTEPVKGDRYRWLLLTVIGVAVTGFGSLMTLVTVSLDPIADDLNSERVTALWLLTGLMLAMAVCTPLGGKVSDAFGHKRVFLGSLGAMTTLMLLSAVAPNMATLIALRSLFGLAGAALMPSSMALVMNAFPIDERAKAVAYFQMAMTGGPTIGVVVGGPLIDIIGWRGIFVVFGAVALAAAVFGTVVIRPVQGHGKVEIDWLGTLLLAGGTLAVLFVIITAAEGADLLGPRVLGLIGAAVASFVAFALWELRCPSPLLDVRLFLRAKFTASLFASACNQFAYMGGFVLVPKLLSGPYGYSTGIAALLMMPRPGLFAVASPIGGVLPGRIGFRIPMLVGTGTMVASMVAFAAGSDGSALWLLIVGLSLSGISAGVASPSYQTLVANSVDSSDLGVANGMSQTVMWIGIIMGIQSMGAFAGENPTTADYRWTFMFGAIVATFGLIAPALVDRRRDRAPS